ncbi:MAG: HIT family protein [Pigmentiphaga sp.]|nr:HIT family protein [Pigmentiphaga sp.]
MCREPASVLWSHPDLFVIEAAEPGYPGFTRVIWRRHVAEMTDLQAAERDRLMSVVWCVEAAQRGVLRPRKVNLASLGNQVPHLHWHIIPRWAGDPAYPDAVWAPARRQPGADPVTANELARYRVELVQALGMLAAGWR